MTTQRNQTGRHFLVRRSPGGALPHNYNSYSLLILVTACLISSCSPGIPDTYDNYQIDVPPDSCSFTVCFSLSDNTSDIPHGVQKLDVFVYDADGLKSLLDTRSYDFLPDSILLYGPEGDRLIVAVANSPLAFNHEALARYDSIELLCYNFSDDSPKAPLMSGMCEVGPDGRGQTTLTPLMARVQLGEISNTMKGYARLEDPRIYLSNMNGSAELLRSMGFRPSETIQDPPVVSLPYDIGIFPQNPGTELFCYPNDSPVTIGTPATALVLECEIGGVTHSFSTPLPSVCRNTTTHVDLCISGPDEFDSRIY